MSEDIVKGMSGDRFVEILGHGGDKLSDEDMDAIRMANEIPDRNLFFVRG